MNLSLEHGNSDGSPLAYVCLGTSSGRASATTDAAFRFGKLGFDLVEQRGLLRFKAPRLLLLRRPGHPLGRTRRAAASSCCGARSTRRSRPATSSSRPTRCNAWSRSCSLTGDPLAEVQRDRRGRRSRSSRKAKFGLVRGRPHRRSSSSSGTLRGIDPSFGVVRRRRTSTSRPFEQRLEGDPSLAIAAAGTGSASCRARFCAGDYAAALEAAARGRGPLWTRRRSPRSPSTTSTRALARAAALRRRAGRRAAPAPARRSPSTTGSCRSGPRAARRTSRTAPRCVGAELARLRGDGDEAMRLYEEAIRSARDSGFVHNEAIAYEAAARFYRARGLALFADAYLREARDRYLRWGADGKVRDLERRHPQLVEARPLRRRRRPLALRAEQLDLLSVVKASQTISGVMVRERLSRTLLRLVLEAGGARRAWSSRGRGRARGRGGGPLRSPRRRPAPSGRPARGPSRSRSSGMCSGPRSGCSSTTRPRTPAGSPATSTWRAPAPARCCACPFAGRRRSSALLYLENDLVPGRLHARAPAGARAARRAGGDLPGERALLGTRARRPSRGGGRRAASASCSSEATALMSSTARLRRDVRRADPAVRALVRRLGDHRSRSTGTRTVRVAGAHRDPREGAAAARAVGALPGAASARPRRRRPFSRAAGPSLLPDISDDDIRALHGRRAPRRAHRPARNPQRHRRAARRARHAARRADARRLRRPDGSGRPTSSWRWRSAAARRWPSTMLACCARRSRRCGCATSSCPWRRTSYARRSPPSCSRSIGCSATAAEAAAPARGADTQPRIACDTAPSGCSSSPNELLDVTRIEQGCLDLAPDEVELGALAAEVVEELRARSRRGRLRGARRRRRPVVGCGIARASSR